MTPQEAVLKLGECDWTEARIAREVGTSQPTIHRIKHGSQRVTFDVGTKLVELAERELRSKRKRAA